MRQVATDTLMGIHDCSVFCRDKRKREDHRSTVRNIVNILIEHHHQNNINNDIDEEDDDDDDDVSTDGAMMVTIYIQADFFLTNMCRRLVGLLVQVGLGKISPDQVRETLGTDFKHPPTHLRDRFLVTAPARGLCLERVLYDPSGRGGDPTLPARG